MKEDGRIISQFWFFTKSIIASDIQRKFENSKDERRVQRRWLREVDEKSLKCYAVHVNNAFKENTIIYGNVVDYYGSVHLVEIAKWSSSPLYERKRCTHLFIHALTETAFCSLIFVEFFNVFFFFLNFSIVRKAISPKLCTIRRKMKHFNYISRVLVSTMWRFLLVWISQFDSPYIWYSLCLYCVLYAFFTQFSNVIVSVQILLSSDSARVFSSSIFLSLLRWIVSLRSHLLCTVK